VTTQEEVTIVLDVEDIQALKALAEAVRGVDKFGEEVDDVGKKTERASKRTGLLSKSLGGPLKAGLTIAASQAVALAGALAGVLAVGKQLVDAFQEQDVVNRQLEDSLSRAGVQADELGGRFDELSALISRFANSTNFGDEDISRGLATFIDLTGQATVAQDELSVILGIAARRNVDTQAASELYAKALKGEVESLKNLTPLTKTQAEELNKLTDQSEKTQRVQALLSAQFKGLAEDIDPTFRSIKNLSDVAGDLQQAFGQVIVQSGAIPAVLDPVIGALREVEQGTFDSSKQLQLLVLNGFLRGAEAVGSFTQFLLDNRQAIVFVVQALRVGVRVFEAINNVIGLVRRAIFTLVETAFVGLISAVEGLLNGVAGAAEALGDDGLAREIRGVAKEAGGFADVIAEDVRKNVQGLKDDAAGVLDPLAEVPDVLDESRALIEKTEAGLKRIQGTTNEVVANLKAQTKEIEKGNGARRAPRSAPVRATGEVANDAGKKSLTEQERAQIALNAALERAAGLRLESLDLLDEHKRAVLEAEAKEIEILARTEEGAQRELALRENQVALGERLADIDERRREAAEALTQEQVAQLEATRAALSGLSNLGSASSAINDIAAAVGAVGEATILAKQAQLDQTKAASAQVAAINASVTGIAALTSATIKGDRDQSRIKAIVNGAAAAAAFAGYAASSFTAAPLLQASIGFTSAAASYATAAGTSAPSSLGGGGGGGSSSGQAQGATQIPDVQRAADINAQAIAEALSEQGAGDTIIILDQRGAFLASDSPAFDRVVADSASRGLRSQGIDIDTINARRRGR